MDESWSGFPWRVKKNESRVCGERREILSWRIVDVGFRVRAPVTIGRSADWIKICTFDCFGVCIFDGFRW